MRSLLRPLSLILHSKQFLDDQTAVRVLLVEVDLAELGGPKTLRGICLSGCKLHLFTRGRKMWGCFIYVHIASVQTQSATLSNKLLYKEYESWSCRPLME